MKGTAEGAAAGRAVGYVGGCAVRVGEARGRCEGKSHPCSWLRLSLEHRI